MKKIALFSIIILAFIFQLSAQIDSIGAVIGRHFIQGNTGVVNSFQTKNGYPPGTNYVKFVISDVLYTTAYDTGWGSYDSQYDDFTWQVDMGVLPSNAPQNLVAYASYYDVNHAPLNGGTFSADWPFTLTPIPEWITTYSGQVTNTTVNYGNNTLSMQGTLPLNSLLALNKSVSGILGLAGKAFSMTNQNLTFDITYNMATGTATGAQGSISGDFQPLDNSSSAIAGTNFSGNITFDTDFNLTFNGTAIIDPAPITKSYNFENVPLTGANFQFASIGALCVNTSLEFSLKPKFKAQIYAGYDGASQHWGFKQSGSDVTQFLGKVTASATAKGELKAVCGSAFGFSMGWGTLARGEVTAELNIGGGIQYHNIPNATSPTNLWYGDFSIHAEGQVLGYDTKSGDYTPAGWGDSSSFSFKTENTANEFFQNSTTESRSIQTPTAWPMEKIATRDSVAATAWIDDINFSNEASLLVSYYSPVTNTFSLPITVAKNDSGVTNPSISLLPNKNIFVTWSQLNKSKSQLAGVNLDDVTKSQDIYIAIIDITSNSVVYKNKLTDAASDGRADGEPRIHWGNGNQGMITWQAGDNTNMGSDIYAAEISESGGNYTIYNHAVLNAAVPGFNYNVTISYGNNNEAIATWFNDPDMNQTTNNSEIYYSSWNGSAWWATPELRFDAGSLGINIKDYSLATHDSYGVEALTYEYFDANEETVNGIYLSGWNDGDLINMHPYITAQDTTQDFALPQVSVSRNGIASLVLQEKDFLNPNSEGRLNLYLKDLNNLPAQWQEVIQTNPQYAQFIADTNQFVWDMSAKFGYLSNSSDVIYLFTQEMDNAGNTNATSYGKIFGNPNLNLLLRAFQVNNSGGTITLTDLAEPSTDNVTGFYQELQPFNNTFELKPAFPNPFNDETHIPFHLYQGSDVKIELYNLSGQSMGEIYNASLSAGSYVTTFKRRNLESGIYFYRVIMGNDVQTGKMVITD